MGPIGGRNYLETSGRKDKVRYRDVDKKMQRVMINVQFAMVSITNFSCQTTNIALPSDRFCTCQCEIFCFAADGDSFQ